MLIAEGFIPRVALDVMNEVHDEEIRFLNELDILISKREAGEDVDSLLEAKLTAFLEHIEYHFSNEERMMLENNVPVYPIHKGEHDRVRAEMKAMCADWRSDEGFARFSAYIRKGIPEWFANHVATMDTITAQILSQVMA